MTFNDFRKNIEELTKEKVPEDVKKVVTTVLMNNVNEINEIINEKNNY